MRFLTCKLYNVSHLAKNIMLRLHFVISLIKAGHPEGMACFLNILINDYFTTDKCCVNVPCSVRTTTL